MAEFNHQERSQDGTTCTIVRASIPYISYEYTQRTQGILRKIAQRHSESTRPEIENDSEAAGDSARQRHSTFAFVFLSSDFTSATCLPLFVVDAMEDRVKFRHHSVTALQSELI
jgi:hypothetical protein